MGSDEKYSFAEEDRALSSYTGAQGNNHCIFFFFWSHWLAEVYCLVFCIGSCVPVPEDRTEDRGDRSLRSKFVVFAIVIPTQPAMAMGTFEANLWHVLLLLILSPPYLVHAKITQTPRGRARTREIRET